MREVQACIHDDRVSAYQARGMAATGERYQRASETGGVPCTQANR